MSTNSRNASRLYSWANSVGRRLDSFADAPGDFQDHGWMAQHPKDPNPVAGVDRMGRYRGDGQNGTGQRRISFLPHYAMNSV
jgi:hypothetical protein